MIQCVLTLWCMNTRAVCQQVCVLSDVDETRHWFSGCSMKSDSDYFELLLKGLWVLLLF